MSKRRSVSRALPLRPLNDILFGVAQMSTINRLLSNASRVREFGYGAGENIPSGLTAVRQHISPGTILLPNLRKLSVSLNGKQTTENILMLLGPKLEALSIYMTSSQGAECLQTIMDELPRQTPGVQKLVITVILTSRMALTNGMSSLTNLVHLDATGPGFETHAVMDMAALPHLRSLKISLPPDFSLLGAVALQAPFPSLSSLTLCGVRSLESLSAFSQLLGSHPALNYLDLDLCPNVNYPSIVHRAIRFISTLTALKYLHLSGPGSHAIPAGESRASYDIRPLFRLTQLRTLSLCLVGGKDTVVDDTIPAFAQAWPQLTSFEYVQDPQNGMQRAGLTLRALALFAEHLPHLFNLILDLDATTVPGRETITTCSSVPIDLDFGESLINGQRCFDVAVYIRALYANAKATPSEVLDGWDSEQRGAWGRVSDVLWAMKREG